jgi:predicted RNase H-like HicB family nuclease
MNAGDYLMLPWTVNGPAQVTDEHGNTHYEMRVMELPDFLVAASSEAEALHDFRSALTAFLESYSNEGEVPPVPDGKATSFA